MSFKPSVPLPQLSEMTAQSAASLPRKTFSWLAIPPLRYHVNKRLAMSIVTRRAPRPMTNLLEFAIEE